MPQLVNFVHNRNSYVLLLCCGPDMRLIPDPVPSPNMDNGLSRYEVNSRFSLLPQHGLWNSYQTKFAILGLSSLQEAMNLTSGISSYSK